MLNCGKHKCPSSCHQLSDHSKMLCRTVLSQNCAKGHSQTWKCHAGPPAVCAKCERERKDMIQKAQQALQDQLKRDEATQRHLREIAKIEEDINAINNSIKDARVASEQENIIKQRKRDLLAA